MVSIATARALAAAFEAASEEPHFEKTSFRVNKKIFLTIDEKNTRACIKLNASDQSVFSAFDNAVFYAIPNTWCKQGWTFIELKKVRKDMFLDALTCSYCEVAPEKLAEKYRQV
jgi:predicted DNA-binding protein (MmcQ/YjbR family)